MVNQIRQSKLTSKICRGHMVAGDRQMGRSKLTSKICWGAWLLAIDSVHSAVCATYLWRCGCMNIYHTFWKADLSICVMGDIIGIVSYNRIPWIHYYKCTRVINDNVY